MTVMTGDDPAAPEPLTDEERAEVESYEALVCQLAIVLMRLDGNDGDPHRTVWSVGTIPEPWGDAWQKYEPQALSVLDAIGEGSARALVAAHHNAARYRWVRERNPHVLTTVAYSVEAARAFPLTDPDGALDAAMGVQPQHAPPAWLDEALSILNDIRKDVRQSKFGGLQCDELERVLRDAAGVKGLDHG